MTKATTERLETIATWREQYGNGANVMIPAEEAELMARQLLAYEQAAHAQPVIPEGLLQAINRLLDNDGSRGCFDALEQHRAKTELERLLASTAQPVSKPYKLPVIGWIRSDYDSDRRMGDAPIFILGQNNPSSTWDVGYIPLTGNSPVIPDGWKLVPIEPTPKMLVAAMGMFTAEELAEAWGDMIEAAQAPAQEQK